VATAVNGEAIPPYVEMHGTTVRAVEAELGRIWQETTSGNGRDGVVTEKAAPQARTSVLNLIVTVPDRSASDRVLATLLRLGARHPSRAILLHADPDSDGDPIDARIRTHCHVGDNGENEGGRVCFEQLELTVRGEAARHLDGIVAPLVIHDLPIEVWWPGDPPFHDPVFQQLVDFGDRLVVNSSDFTDLAAGLKRLAAIRRRLGVGDISWERLAPWHELTAQFFDGPRFRRFLPNLSRLVIKYAVPDPDAEGEPGPPHPDETIHGGLAPAAGALLYAGWIATRLAWRRAEWREPPAAGGLRLSLEGRYEMVDLVIEQVPTAAVPPGELVSVRLRAFGEAGAAEFIVDRPATEAVVVTNADGMTANLRRMPLAPESETEVLRRQLVVDQRDPVYEDALRGAVILISTQQAA
jgi:glucose-6-phosphate dehydrogenase assembly protein OpcA